MKCNGRCLIVAVAPVVLKNDGIKWEELKYLLYKQRAFHNVVISPGPGSPKCASDIGMRSSTSTFAGPISLHIVRSPLWECSGVCMQLLKECDDIPILGVCMGHQVRLSSPASSIVLFIPLSGRQCLL